MRQRRPTVLACSALKRKYRARLLSHDGKQQHSDQILFVHLAGTPETIRARMSARQGHFMKGEHMLNSQYAALEPLCPIQERGLTIDDLTAPAQEIAEHIAEQVLHLKNGELPLNNNKKLPTQ